MTGVDFLEAVFIEYAGPMGKFVLKKKVKELGFEWDTFPEEKLWDLAQDAVPNAIFDPGVQTKVLGILRKVLITPSTTCL